MEATAEEKKALRGAKNIIKSKRYTSIFDLEMLLLISDISQRRLGVILGYSSSGSMNRIIQGNKKMSVEKKKVLAEVLKLNKSERLALLEGA